MPHWKHDIGTKTWKAEEASLVYLEAEHSKKRKQQVHMSGSGVGPSVFNEKPEGQYGWREGNNENSGGR